LVSDPLVKCFWKVVPVVVEHGIVRIPVGW